MNFSLPFFTLRSLRNRLCNCLSLLAAFFTRVYHIFGWHISLSLHWLQKAFIETRLSSNDLILIVNKENSWTFFLRQFSTIFHWFRSLFRSKLFKICTRELQDTHSLSKAVLINNWLRPHCDRRKIIVGNPSEREREDSFPVATCFASIIDSHFQPAWGQWNNKKAPYSKLLHHNLKH